MRWEGNEQSENVEDRRGEGGGGGGGGGFFGGRSIGIGTIATAATFTAADRKSVV